MSRPTYTPKRRRVRGSNEAPPAPREAPLSHTHGSARLDGAVDARLVALGERMSTSWHTMNRSEVLRAVILAGLPVVEAAYPPKENDPSKKAGPR
jgi:hypothetical protein